MPNLNAILGTVISLCLLHASRSAAGAAEPPASAQVKLAHVAGGITKPVHVAFAPGSSGPMYVLEEAGFAVEVDNGSKKAEAFLDLTPYAGLEGLEDEPEAVQLLSLAFHPSYTENGKAFVTFVRKKGKSNRFVLAEFLLNRETGRLNRETERIIFTIEQRGDYFGGGLAFDKKGMLVVGVADGGGSHDPKNRAQNLNDHAGTILRLNVDEGETYVPPLDNPYVMNDMGLREIFAYGLRDPWKLSVDRQTGYIWAGDRGEDTYEEINLIEAGNNYGWSVYEGKLCLRMRFECQNDTMVAPALMYTRQYGKAVTGGHVYRGTKIPYLQGRYVYADFHSGRIWSMALQDKKPTGFEELVQTKHQLSSFGEDGQGELYVSDYRGGDIYRLEPLQAPKEAVSAESIPEAQAPPAAGPAKKALRITK